MDNVEIKIRAGREETDLSVSGGKSSSLLADLMVEMVERERRYLLADVNTTDLIHIPA